MSEVVYGILSKLFFESRPENGIITFLIGQDEVGSTSFLERPPGSTVRIPCVDLAEDVANIPSQLSSVIV